MYYYYMDSFHDESDCQGFIRTADINKILLKDMSDSKEEGHAFILDVGGRKYHMNCRFRFELDVWVQAIYISMQTARESKSSINNSCKNIAQIIISYDCEKEKLQAQTEEYLIGKLFTEAEDWADNTDELLNACSEVRDDLVTTFDACLAQPKQRVDIVRFYMDVSHTYILKLLG